MLVNRSAHMQEGKKEKKKKKKGKKASDVLSQEKKEGMQKHAKNKQKIKTSPCRSNSYVF